MRSIAVRYVRSRPSWGPVIRRNEGGITRLWTATGKGPGRALQSYAIEGSGFVQQGGSMRFRIAIVTAVLVTLGSSADATILNIVSCETGKPIPGVQKRAGEGGQHSETIRYEVSAPGFIQRAFHVEVDTVTEACLESAPAPSEQPQETTTGSQQHEGQGGNQRAGRRDGGGSHSEGGELLRLPGPSADERARQHLETHEQQPAPWVDTGPEENVDGQIGSMGHLLNAKKAPPQTRTRVATPDPSTATPTESDTTPEFVPDDTGLYGAEEVADALCRASDTAGANERSDQWGAAYCADFNSFKAQKRARQQAKQQGLDPDKTHPYTNAQQKMKTLIEDGARDAVKAAQASCATKITCAAVACTTQCDVSFEKLVETASCKRKRNKGPKRKMQKKRRPAMADRLRVKVIGNCGCTCAPKAACGGIEAAM